MKDRELLTQLNKLSNITPSENWKGRNRNSLIAQISSSNSNEKGYSFFKLSLQIFTSATQPVMVVVLLFVMMGAIGIGFKVGEDSKPGDSMYIAKRISERTRASLVFDEKQRVRLGIGFAKNRAEEIEKVLASPEGMDTEKNVDKLVYDFKNEIAVARKRIEKIYISEVDSDNIDNLNQDTIDDDIEEEVVVFIANANKDEDGVTISDSIIIDNKEEVELSTSTDDISDIEEIEKEVTESSPQEILEQANDFVESEEFEAALDKLDEASNIVENINKVDDVEEVEIEIVKTENEVVGTSSVEDVIISE